MYAFDFERPSTLAEAEKALATEDAQALGGGQTLIPTLKQRLAMPSKLVSLGAIDEIKGVRKSDDGALCVGGGATHATVAREAAADYPALAALASHIGDPAVRNRGHHRWQHRQQRPGGLLSGGGAGFGGRRWSPTSARSRRMITSRGCSRPPSTRARSSPRCVSRSLKRPTTRSLNSPRRALRWSGCSSRNTQMAYGWP